MMSGILVLKKPAAMTSHDVVDAVRRLTGEQRVGHAGTLDPFATGVLVIGVGREATRVLGGISSHTKKSYRATIRLGACSDTDDADGVITERDDPPKPTKVELVKTLRRFHGDVQQTPPQYSSIKVSGVRAYKRARRGEAVTLAPRQVTIYDLAIRSYAWPNLVLEVACSSGTYIRSLARDIGEALGTGAYCAELTRTAVGLYVLSLAHTLEEIQDRPQEFFLPIPSIPRS